MIPLVCGVEEIFFLSLHDRFPNIVFLSTSYFITSRSILSDMSSVIMMDERHQNLSQGTFREKPGIGIHPDIFSPGMITWLSR